MEFYQIKAKIKVNWNLWNSSPSVRLIKFFYNSSSCKPKLIDDINFSESFITQYWKKGATKIMKAFSGQATGWTSRCKSSRLLEQSTWIEIIIFKKDFWLIPWLNFYFSKRGNYCLQIFEDGNFPPFSAFWGLDQRDAAQMWYFHLYRG